MLYELLSGKPPFAGASTVDVLRMHLTTTPPSLEVDELDRSQHEALDAVIQKAMAKAPKDRYQDAASFRRELLSCLIGTDPAVVEKTHQRMQAARFASITLGPSLAKTKLALPAIGAALALVSAIALITVITTSADSVDLEQALSAGDLTRAQAELDELVASSPEDPRIPLYEGHLAYAKPDIKAAFEAYQRALANPQLEVDARFEANVLDLLRTRAKAAEVYVKMISDRGGPSTVPTLVKVFGEGPNPLLRRYAYEGLVRHDAARQVPDPVGVLAEDLKKQSNKNCKTRKWYVEQLIRFDDDRVLTALEAEQNRRGNIFQEIGGGVNKCMGGLIETEIVKRRS
jgi:hypothetical protein